MHIPKYIAADFSKIKTRNKENIKTGWGTDRQYTLENISDADTDKRCKSTKSLVLYNVQNNLRHVMKYSKNTSDALINNANESIMPSSKSHTWMYKYFAFVWQRFLTVFKECSKNWKTKFTLTSGLTITMMTAADTSNGLDYQHFIFLIKYLFRYR